MICTPQSSLCLVAVQIHSINFLEQDVFSEYRPAAKMELRLLPRQLPPLGGVPPFGKTILFPKLVSVTRTQVLTTYLNQARFSHALSLKLRLSLALPLTV
jgi:hypothetical protein